MNTPIAHAIDTLLAIETPAMRWLSKAGPDARRLNEEAKMDALGCSYCEREAEPGWIETDNNGPVVPCPVCNRENDPLERVDVEEGN